MSIRNLVSISALMVFVVSCGLDPMTEEQKAQFKETMTSVGKITDAVNTRGKTGTRIAVAFAGFPMHQKMADQFFAALRPRENTSRANNEVADALTAGWASCAAEGEIPDDLVPTGSNDVSASKAVSVSYKITGANCPMIVEFSVTASAGTTSGSGTIRIAWTVQDDVLKSATKITSGEITGSFSISGGNSYASADLDLDGTIQHVDHGALSFYIECDFSVSGGSTSASIDFEFAIGVKYPDFIGEAKVTYEQTFTSSGAGEAEMHYYLSDEEVTEEVFKEYVVAFSPTEISRW